MNEIKSKKIKLYKLPLIEQIMCILSAIGLTAIPVALIGWEVYNFEVIILLIVMIFVCILMYVSAFDSYICLDFEKQELIIRDGIATKKETIKLYCIEKIVCKDSERDKHLFTIQIKFKNSTLAREISDWSTRIGIFNSYNRQKRRVLKFSDRCNRLLEEYHFFNKSQKDDSI